LAIRAGAVGDPRFTATKVAVPTPRDNTSQWHLPRRLSENQISAGLWFARQTLNELFPKALRRLRQIRRCQPEPGGRSQCLVRIGPKKGTRTFTFSNDSKSSFKWFVDRNAA
jgi:hypothetical protein